MCDQKRIEDLEKVTKGILAVQKKNVLMSDEYLAGYEKMLLELNARIGILEKRLNDMGGNCDN